MEKKIMRRRTLVGVGLFVVIFSGLLALASLFDLEVSQKLTAGNLSSGQYYADTFFGRLFEVIGSFPIWISIAVIGAIFYHNAKNNNIPNLFKQKDSVVNVLNKLIEFVAIVMVIASFYFLFADSFKYFLKYSHGYHLKKSLAYVASMLILAVIVAPTFIVAWGKISVEQNKKLMTFALIIVLALITRIFIEGIKLPIGRMRFRAMNLIGDFSYYTPWYVINGVRELPDVIGNSALNFSAYEHEFDDMFKSFPSGHTFAAGMSYLIICLPDFIKKWDNVVGRFLCWTLPIVYTGMVAISRIMVGAHYFSDVLIGGTIVFLGVIIGREIFVFKGKHITCFFKDKEKIAE